MKITILLRFPKVERSGWKRDLIDKLISNGFEVNLIFGESSYWRHLKAALKKFGMGSFRRYAETSSVSSSTSKENVKIYNYFKKKIAVKKVNDLNSKRTEKIINNFTPDYLLLLGSGIIRKNILKLPMYKPVHCHQGYLPVFRGVHTIEWSLLLTGEVYLTTHFVDTGIDTGDILLRKKIDILRDDSIETLRRRCQLESVDFILETMFALRDGTIQPEKKKKNQGKQYFSMHPLFEEMVTRKIKKMGA